MLSIVKERKGDVMIMRLSGSIEENVNFEQMVGSAPPEIHVNCKEVVRINSEGVKAWIRYFSSMKMKGVRIKFIECSTAIVEQINMISNFSASSTVESIYAPYSCKECKSEFICLFKVDELKRNNKKLPALKCSKCTSELIFDDIAEEYFVFLDRISS